jgi:P27 family predicted phage terminase small subunit
MRGRKPLPTAVKEASGAFEKDPNRRNLDEPQAKKGIPPIPESIVEDDVASKCWESVCGTLNDMGILTVADASVMELYCVTYSQWRCLSNVVKNGNCSTVDDKGRVSTSPEANQVHKYSATLLRLMAELGLTPSSRSRIHAEPRVEDDPFTDFLKRRMESKN